MTRPLYKRIHMPKPLYDEIEAFVSKPESSYKNPSELCREAGRILIEHHKLRDRYA